MPFEVADTEQPIRWPACGAVESVSGLPALVLWGETVEVIWRPPSEKVMVLRHPTGLELLPVETVFERLRGLWPTD
jgi:hypothetical protein